MQEILTKFLDTAEQTPALLQLDGALRYVFPLLALVILIRCGKSLLMFRREPEVWAWLAGPTGDRIPVMHWESLIGRGKGCDVTLEYPTISRTHAVLTRYDDGSWTIMDAGSTGGVFVNGKQQSLSVVRFGDVLSFGGVEFTLVPITQEQERIQAEARTRRAVVRPWLTLLLLTLFQMLACAQFSRYADPRLAGHGALPQDGQPWLPLSELLQTMLESGRLQLPWLEPTGFSDLRFAAPLPLPEAVTRECRITARSQSWLLQDGVMTRMCHVRLQSRDLAPNLRRINHFSPLARGMVFLAAAAGSLPPLWDGEMTVTGPDLPLEDFYAGCGMAEGWRLLEELAPAGDDLWQGRFDGMAQGIAPAGKSGYCSLLSAVDAILQAACRIMEETVPGAELAGGRLLWPQGWRLSGIGFIRFADAGLLSGARMPWRIQLRRGWDDERLQRYDAQVVDADGRVLLTLHQMEFEKDIRPQEGAGA